MLKFSEFLSDNFNRPSLRQRKPHSMFCATRKITRNQNRAGRPGNLTRYNQRTCETQCLKLKNCASLSMNGITLEVWKKIAICVPVHVNVHHIHHHSHRTGIPIVLVWLACGSSHQNMFNLAIDTETHTCLHVPSSFSAEIPHESDQD